MLNNNHLKSTEKMARKHANPSNAKSSFNYLIRNKMAVQKGKVVDKENDQDRYPCISAQQIAKVNRSFNTEKSQKRYFSAILPLHHVENIHQTKPSSDIKDSPIQDKHIEYTLQSNSSVTNEQILGIQSHLKENTQTEQSSCMTDDCYAQKQLEIKYFLVQKERDNLWDSITQIVTQNLNLKDILSKMTIEKESKIQAQMQTEAEPVIEVIQPLIIYFSQNQCQTELISQDINLLEFRYQNCRKQIDENLSYMNALHNKQNTSQLIEFLNLKDSILHLINTFANNSDKNLQLQKQKYELFRQKQLKKHEDYKKQIQEATISMKNEKEMLLHHKKALQIQIYEKNIEINEYSKNNQYIMDNVICYQEENLQLKIENQRNRQEFEVEKMRSDEKHKIMNSLLLQSHKTINNLMVQMQQFEKLASNSYEKYLASEKNTKRLNKNTIKS